MGTNVYQQTHVADQANRVAIPMDIEISEEQQNILSDIGYSNTLFQILNLRPGSGAFTAPVCSSWVFMRLELASNMFDET